MPTTFCERPTAWRLNPLPMRYANERTRSAAVASMPITVGATSACWDDALLCGTQFRCEAMAAHVQVLENENRSGLR